MHGVALGFGATMLGVSVDYPVLMIGHRKRGEAAPATRARIGRAFVLAVLAALLGLAAMVFSGFPGLRSWGCSPPRGWRLRGADLAVLPRLVVRGEPGAGGGGRPGLAGAGGGVAAVPLVGGGAGAGRRRGSCCRTGCAWEGDLQALSPVPAASLALDREMRAQLGAPDAGQVLLVRGATARGGAGNGGAAGARAGPAAGAGACWADAADAARLLPSAAVQRARLAALPDAAVLAGAAWRRRQAGLPFRPAALRPVRGGGGRGPRGRTADCRRTLAGTPVAAAAVAAAAAPRGWLAGPAGGAGRRARPGPAVAEAVAAAVGERAAYRGHAGRELAAHPVGG